MPVLELLNNTILRVAIFTTQIQSSPSLEIFASYVDETSSHFHRLLLPAYLQTPTNTPHQLTIPAFFLLLSVMCILLIAFFLVFYHSRLTAPPFVAPRRSRRPRITPPPCRLPAFSIGSLESSLASRTTTSPPMWDTMRSCSFGSTGFPSESWSSSPFCSSSWPPSTIFWELCMLTSTKSTVTLSFGSPLRMSSQAHGCCGFTAFVRSC